MRELRMHNVWERVVGKGRHTIQYYKISRVKAIPSVQGLEERVGMGASYNLLICPSHQHLVMRPIWVRRADGGQWVHLGSVADAVAHVKLNGTDIPLVCV